MTCQELVELVTDYLDGELADEDRIAFDAHLALCPGCVTYVRQVRTTAALVHDAEALRERPDVAALLRTFAGFARTRPATR